MITSNALVFLRAMFLVALVNIPTFLPPHSHLLSYMVGFIKFADSSVRAVHLGIRDRMSFVACIERIYNFFTQEGQFVEFSVSKR